MTNPPGSVFEGGLQILVYLCLLGGLLAMALILQRKGLPFFGKTGAATRKLQISESRALAGRQFLIVAEYENKKVLIGVSPGRIDYLCNLSSTPEEDRFSNILGSMPNEKSEPEV
jgi:flagellar biogenesis protein FliO